MGASEAFDPAADGWKAYAPERGFERHVGPIWSKRRAPGRMRFGFLAGPHHVNPNGVVHGGMLVTFLDHVCGALVWWAAGKKTCATVTLNSDFISSAQQGEWIEGEATLVRKGQSLVFVRAEASVGDRIVMTASGIWKVFDAT
ncbi:MAG TPA: PaaI family thioesterase [Candidatus Cybelea sp.]|nr:PaaI family thioesterase [Candidatus Cybelea sp.]